jgi:hypothetical protein
MLYPLLLLLVVGLKTRSCLHAMRCAANALAATAAAAAAVADGCSLMEFVYSLAAGPTSMCHLLL